MAFTYSQTGFVGTLTAAAGENAGLNFDGRPPGTTLTITGAFSLASITGYNSGTAGTGTSATSLAKPAGGTNWTASALPGYLLAAVVGGVTYYRQILSNTTTTLAISSIPGLDNTCTFQILNYGSQIDRISSTDLIAIRASSCFGKVEIIGLDFSTAHTLDGLIELIDCADVKVEACKLSQNLTNPALSITRCSKVQVNHCRLTSSSDVVITGADSVSMTGCVNAAGGVIDISDCRQADVIGLTADSAPSRVLSMTRVNSATAEVAASNGGATPVYLDSCNHFRVSGGCLTGSGNTGYGIEIANSGEYTLTGSSITGTTGDVYFAGGNRTWALHFGSSYGRVATAISNAVAQVSVTMTIFYGNYLFDGDTNFSSRVLTYGILNPAQMTGVVAAGTSASDAYQLPGGVFYRIETCPSGAGVKLHNAAALPGPGIDIYNATGTTAHVYPTSGTINGAASVTVAGGALLKLQIVDSTYDTWLSY